MITKHHIVIPNLLTHVSSSSASIFRDVKKASCTIENNKSISRKNALRTSHSNRGDAGGTSTIYNSLRGSSDDQGFQLLLGSQSSLHPNIWINNEIKL